MVTSTVMISKTPLKLVPPRVGVGVRLLLRLGVKLQVLLQVMNIYAYICMFLMYVRVYVCLYMSTNKQIFIYIEMHVYVKIYVYMAWSRVLSATSGDIERYAYMCICTYVYTHMPICISYTCVLKL
jgi:hypothetical protein